MIDCFETKSYNVSLSVWSNSDHSFCSDYPFILIPNQFRTFQFVVFIVIKCDIAFRSDFLLVISDSSICFKANYGDFGFHPKTLIILLGKTSFDHPIPIYLSRTEVYDDLDNSGIAIHNLMFFPRWIFDFRSEVTMNQFLQYHLNKIEEPIPSRKEAIVKKSALSQQSDISTIILLSPIQKRNQSPPCINTCYNILTFESAIPPLNHVYFCNIWFRCWKSAHRFLEKQGFPICHTLLREEFYRHLFTPNIEKTIVLS